MSTEQTILSLDIGTQGTKATIVGADGSLHGSTFCANRFVRRTPGEIAIDPEEMMRGIADAVRALVAEQPEAASRIAGIGMDGMMAGTVGIDADWKPVFLYDTGLDKRCEERIVEMQAEDRDRRVIELCGCPIIVAQGAKMYWWKEAEPEVFRKVAKFVPISTYAGGCLAGLTAEEAYIDYTHVHLTSFADIRANTWSKELLAQYDFPEEKLPRILAPFEIIGHLTKDWAEAMGLASGIPIVAGCGDTAASTFGAGVVRNNTVLDIAGTASVFTACVDRYQPDTEKKILIYPRSVLPDLWTPFGFVLGGQALSWYHEQINYDGDLHFEDLAREAAKRRDEELFFIPFFAGRISPSQPLFSGSWHGMQFYHERGDLFRSIMESIAFEYRFYLLRLQELLPELAPDEVLVSGGGARSPEFCQIKADVLELPLVAMEQRDTSHLAVAAITGYAVGLHADMAEAILKMSANNAGVAYAPDPALAGYYGKQYRKYRALIDYQYSWFYPEP